ncbi:MAG TPA: TRAP transporter TatT component family protein [Polyangiaceae bacterium]|jgi:hypothetical protein|nr:TRAP transporter TatT component family protein [Polyangiaceae bacterium]
MRGLGLAIVLAVLSAGCLGGSLVDARVSEARDAEGALDTLHDYEIGQSAAQARVANLEGLYAASGGDSRVALLLARAWTKLTFEFTLDDYERALENGDSPAENYQRLRAQAGFRRGQFYADAWLERRAPGFGAALGDDQALAGWLTRSVRDADAAEALLWAGLSRIGDADAAQPEAAASSAEKVRRVGAILLRHSLSLSSTAASGLGHLGLALAAASGAAADLGLVERELALAESAARGRLLVPLFRARMLACKRDDRRGFERDLDRILRESDPAPALRLENVVAKRRARRYLTSHVVGAECFDAAKTDAPRGAPAAR